MSDPADGPGRLPVRALVHLAQIGNLIRASPTADDRDDAIAVALAAARRYRADGIPWADIAVALGVEEPDIWHWLQIGTPKLPAALPSVPPVALPESRPPPAGPAGQSMPGHISTREYQSQSITQSMHAVARHEAHGHLHQPDQAMAPHRRGVLVISGDPRPGGNLFGPEAAAIRTVLRPTRIDVRELACPDLTEITGALTRLRPAVLHLAAHHEHSAVVLSASGTPLWTSHQTLAGQILAAPALPHLIVLNACATIPLAGHLTAPATAVIAWPGPLDDDQAPFFAASLYGTLAEGTPLTAAFTAASDTTTERWPGLSPPILYRPRPHPLF